VNRHTQKPPPGQAFRRRTVLAGTTAAGLFAAVPRAAAADALRVGLTPVLMTSDLLLLETLQRYLEATTGREVEIVTRRTYQEIAALVLAGQVDAAWICGYPFVRHRSDLALLAVPLWRGEPLYRAYLIADADRSAADWRELRGDTHAFSDPDSNSGYLVTADLLAGEDTHPDAFFARHFFTYGHRNVVRAVASGLADSGSVDGYVWEVMAEDEPALAARTRILRASEPLGFPPVATARAATSSPRARALGDAFRAMHEDPLGRDVLALLRLDAFAEADPALYDPIAAKSARVARFG
jgi:phosphonate transport system substrate-binding protein